MLCPARASASSCGGHVQVPTPGPVDAAVFAIRECCLGPTGPFVEAEFVPVVLTDDGSVEDPSRERVPVTFSEEPGGLLLGHGARELEGGDWRFVGHDERGNERTWSFEIDPELESSAPEQLTLDAGEPHSGSEYSVYSEGSTDVAYVAFDVDFSGPAFAVEVYEVTGGERASEPLTTGVSSYDVLQIGETAPECQGRIEVPPGAPYEVRIAAYADSGELGEWSDFERIDVPTLPSAGCALSPSSRGTNPGWLLLLGGLLLAALRGRWHHGHRSS